MGRAPKPDGSSVAILLFSTARTAVGRPRLVQKVPTAGASVEDLLRALAHEYPSLARIARSSRFFRNGEPVVRLSEIVRPGDELAVHPPYGGG